MYLKEGDRYIVFATKSGADTNPDWYFNLKAHPDIQIEVGDEIIDVRAGEIEGPEHDRIYERQASLYPAFAEYRRRAQEGHPRDGTHAKGEASPEAPEC